MQFQSSVGCPRSLRLIEDTSEEILYFDTGAKRVNSGTFSVNVGENVGSFRSINGFRSI